MAKVVEVGKSYEGRTIRLIEVILDELFFRVFQKSDLIRKNLESRRE
jgi:hypothetical protein